MKKILSIVVTYNGATWVRKCLTSLLNSELVNNRILVIDNGSTDDTIKIISNEFTCVEVIETGENLGFGKANNIGLQKAIKEDSDFVFLLNQDAWLLEKDDLFNLVNAFKNNPLLGICSPVQLKNNDLLDLQFGNYLKKYIPEFYNDFLLKKFSKEIYPIKFVNAASWLISRECIEVCGAFAPIFSHYGEDSEYAERLSYHGFYIGILPKVKIIHDRPQKSLLQLDGEKYKDRLKMMSLNILMNINHSFFRQMFVMLSTMIFKSIKNLFSLRANKIFSPISAIFNGFYKTIEIIKLRERSRKGKAFM